MLNKLSIILIKMEGQRKLWERNWVKVLIKGSIFLRLLRQIKKRNYLLCQPPLPTHYLLCHYLKNI